MPLNFEQQKNLKASIYTTAICGSLLLLFIYMHWEKAAPIASSPETSYMEVDLDPQMVPPPVEPAPIDPPKEVTTSQPAKTRGSAGAGGNTNKEIVKGKTNITTTPIPKAVYIPSNTKAAPLVTNDMFDYPVTVNMPMSGKENRTGLGSNIKGNGTGNGNSDGDKDGNANGTGNGNGGKKKINFNGDAKPAVIYAIIEVSANGVGRYLGVDKGGTANDAIHVNEIKQKIKEIHFDNKGVVYKIKVKFDFKYQ